MKLYIKLRKAAASFDFAQKNRLESVHFNANNGYTLQYMFLLASLRPDDTETTISNKIQAAAAYLDIWIVRRFVNFKTTSREANKGRVFNWVLQMRDMNLEQLVQSLQDDLSQMDDEGQNFKAIHNFYMHQQNRRRVHHILARMTYALEKWTGLETSFDRYSSTKAQTRYEIEHIWANNYDRHKGEFDNATEFSFYRNRLGGLVLLPRGTNQSFRDRPYDQKISHYIKENLLVQSLHYQAYEHNPNFAAVIRKYELAFEPHPKFERDDLDKRQRLYKQLCEIIWSPERIRRVIH